MAGSSEGFEELVASKYPDLQSVRHGDRISDPIRIGSDGEPLAATVILTAEFTSIFIAGFESGDTSTWSSSVPQAPTNLPSRAIGSTGEA
jgi:hypothetical protein